VSWLEYLSSGWTLVVVPTAIAIAAIVGFVKTLLEKRNLELENQKLQIEVAAATSRVVLATDEQVEKYAFRHHFMRRTIRLASIILAVVLPTGLVLNTQLSRSPDVLSPPSPPPPAPGVEIKKKPPPNLSLPTGRWAVRDTQAIAGRRISAIEFGADGRFTATSADGRTAFTGSWGGDTGTLIAKGASTAQPGFRFECDLVYVEHTRSRQSSYVLGHCRGAEDRWTWEMSPTASPQRAPSP
jgi:hypothetical protein